MHFVGLKRPRSILDTLSLVLAVDAFYKFIVAALWDPVSLLNVPR